MTTGTATPAIVPGQGNPETELLVRFKWDLRRMGVVEGMFVTTHGELAAKFGKQVYFGEILGKHSEVYGQFEPGDLTVVTDDADFIAKLKHFVGTHVSGYNPMDYMAEDSEE